MRSMTINCSDARINHCFETTDAASNPHTIMFHFAFHFNHCDDTLKSVVRSCRTVGSCRILRKSIELLDPIDRLDCVRWSSRCHKDMTGHEQPLRSRGWWAFEWLRHSRRCDSLRSLTTMIIVSQMRTVSSPVSIHHAVPTEVVLVWFRLRGCFRWILAFGSVLNQLIPHPIREVRPPFDEFLSQFIAHLI